MNNPQRSVTPFTADESVSIRENFPITQTGTFLNAAAMAPLPLPTAQAMADLARGQTERGYLDMPAWLETMEETRKRGAALIGAETREIAFVRNTADGLSLVASGLDWKKGDEVIICDLEFPSNVYPWMNLQSRGVNVVVVKAENGRAPVELYEAAITERTRLISVSTVQYTTGYRTDLAALGKMTKERGLYFCVDGIQSLGLIPMDVKRYSIDFFACGGHKWLCGPEGIGLFYCRHSLLEKLSLGRVGWHSVVDPINFGSIDFTLAPDARRFEEGTFNLIGLYGLNASLTLLAAGGIERNFAHVLALGERLISGLRERGYGICSPVEEKEERSGITVFSSGDEKEDSRLVAELNRNGIMVMKRGAGIRVAPHFFNVADEIDRLLEVLPHESERGDGVIQWEDAESAKKESGPFGGWAAGGDGIPSSPNGGGGCLYGARQPGRRLFHQ